MSGWRGSLLTAQPIPSPFSGIAVIVVVVVLVVLVIGFVVVQRRVLHKRTKVLGSGGSLYTDRGSSAYTDSSVLGEGAGLG